MAYITKEDLKKFLNIKASNIQYDDVLDDAIACGIDEVQHDTHRDFSGDRLTGDKITNTIINRAGKNLIYSSYDLQSIAVIRHSTDYASVATGDVIDHNDYRIYDNDLGLIELTKTYPEGTYFNIHYTYGYRLGTPDSINKAILLSAALTMAHSNILDFKQLNSVQLGALNQSLANSKLTAFRDPEVFIAKLIKPYKPLPL